MQDGDLVEAAHGEGGDLLHVHGGHPTGPGSEAEAWWAACGASVLTGEGDGPPLLVATAAALAADDALAPFGLDARILGERAALLGLHRQGTTSCGGAARLLAARDGWVAIALPRESDLDLVPALVGAPLDGDPWVAVERWTAQRPAAEVEDRATLLGLAVSAVGRSTAEVVVTGRARTDAPAGGGGSGRRRRPLVIDLTALWAGPLCTDLLRRRGAEIVKVESTTRPDGARRGPAAFHDLLNEGKRSVALDLGSGEGRRVLHGLVEAADVVVTSSRARAVHQLGLDPDAFLAGGADRVWAAITAHGWAVERIGFGDDAAAASGLVAWGEDGVPRFAGDAIADPLTGVVAGHLVDDAWRAGGRWFLDLPLAGVARRVAPAAGPAVPAVPGAPALPAGPDRGGWTTGSGVPLAPPSPRPASGRAAPLGADTASIRARFGL